MASLKGREVIPCFVPFAIISDKAAKPWLDSDLGNYKRVA